MSSIWYETDTIFDHKNYSFDSAHPEKISGLAAGMDCNSD